MGLPLVSSGRAQPVLHPAVSPHGDPGGSQRQTAIGGELRPRRWRRVSHTDVAPVSSTGLDFNPDGIEFANGARWLPEQRRIYLHGVGQVKVHVHHQVQGRVKTIQINRQGRHWMLVLSCDDVAANPLPATGARAGVDVGIVRYATLSDGTGVDNPPWACTASDRLTVAQQRLTGARRG